MIGPRRDTRGIVDPAALMARVRFRRLLPAAALRPYVEHYWFIDWDLDEPYESRVLPHPAVHLVFQRSGGSDSAEVTGVLSDLFRITLTGVGRVCAVKFRPGAFRLFHPAPVSAWTGRRWPVGEVFADAPATAPTVLDPSREADRTAALDAFVSARGPRRDPSAAEAIRLVDAVRRDRSVLRVDRLAAGAGMSVRALQRLFADHVGVGPKWVILRCRVHEAIERAREDVDWARLAAELGYADQAHLVRDFTASIGMSPRAYANSLAEPG